MILAKHLTMYAKILLKNKGVISPFCSCQPSRYCNDPSEESISDKNPTWHSCQVGLGYQQLLALKCASVIGHSMCHHWSHNLPCRTLHHNHTSPITPRQTGEEWLFSQFVQHHLAQEPIDNQPTATWIFHHSYQSQKKYPEYQ